jgi:hypothetical protein
MTPHSPWGTLPGWKRVGSYGFSRIPNMAEDIPWFRTAAQSQRHGLFTIPHVRELTYTYHSTAPFVRHLGHDGPRFSGNEDRRAVLRAERDAWEAQEARPANRPRIAVEAPLGFVSRPRHREDNAGFWVGGRGRNG